MALPYLYSSDDATNDYTKGGLGSLPDCVSLLCTSELNGEVTLSGTVPIKGTNTDNLVNNNIIKVKINDTQEPQIMRLYNVKKSMVDGLITFSAEPISNDIRTGFLPHFTIENSTAGLAMTQMAKASYPKIPDRFIFKSDKENLTSIDLEKVSVLQGLGGVEGSILQKFKGEYEKDNHTVTLHKRLGSDHRLKILYTKNLTGLDIEVNTQGVVNGIYPYATLQSSDGTNTDEILELDEKVVFFDKQYQNGVISAVDFSNDAPTDKKTLLALTQSYMSSNADINEPSVSATIDFILLNNQPKYKEFVNMETVGLGDGVDVYHPILAVDLHARIVKYEFNCLSEQYTKLEVGSVQANFLDQIINQIDTQGQDVNDQLNVLEEAQKEVSDLIKNPSIGHVVIYPSLSNPQEILIMDTTDVNTATKLWRWNSSGLAYSENGYNGDYNLAMTKDGQIVADMMTTGTLRAIDIIGVTISGSTILSQSSDNSSNILLHGGQMSFANADGNNVGLIFPSYDGATKKANGLAIEQIPGFIFSINSKSKTASSSKAVIQIPADSHQDEAYVKFPEYIGGGFRNKDNDFWIMAKTRVILSGNNGSSNALNVYGSKVDVLGDFTVYNGSKNAAHVTRNGIRLTPAYETAESYLGDIGSSKTDDNGQVTIEIETLFSDAVNTDYEYQVFLQSYGDGYVYVSERTATNFTVQSSSPNLSFGWEIKARRRGYEKTRLELSDMTFDELKKIEENQEV